MSIISEGALISVIGMGLVFVVLTLMMLLMLAVERVFRAEGPAQESSPNDRDHTAAGESLRDGLRPDGLAEVGAIALAIAGYMQERGKTLGTSISIDGVDYEVETKVASETQTEIVVNGKGFRGAVSRRISPSRTESMGRMQPRRPTRDGRWRMASPLPQQGYWPRDTWSGRKKASR